MNRTGFLFLFFFQCPKYKYFLVKKTKSVEWLIQDIFFFNKFNYKESVCGGIGLRALALNDIKGRIEDLEVQANRWRVSSAFKIVNAFEIVGYLNGFYSTTFGSLFI